MTNPKTAEIEGFLRTQDMRGTMTQAKEKTKYQIFGEGF